MAAGPERAAEMAEFRQPSKTRLVVLAWKVEKRKWHFSVGAPRNPRWVVDLGTRGTTARGRRAGNEQDEGR